MAKTKFKRGLSAVTLPAVESFLKTQIGRYLKEDDRFLICIRDEYINVYYCGCSILKYEPLVNKFSIHSKYIGTPNSKSYVTLQQRGNNDLGLGDLSLLGIAKNPEVYLSKYVCGEKKYLAEYLSAKHPLLLDLEIAFTRKRDVNNETSQREFVANRIDLAVISEDLALHLIEVKIDRDSRLRSETNGKQEILVQMDYYRNFITNESESIVSSYRTIAQNYIDLDLAHKLSNSPNFIVETLTRFAQSGCLAPEPGLLVIETGKNKIGKKQINHWERLLGQFEFLGHLPPQTWSYPSE